jgi:hypothetical protein
MLLPTADSQLSEKLELQFEYLSFKCCGSNKNAVEVESSWVKHVEVQRGAKE